MVMMEIKDIPRAAKSSLASENSPSSIPSPTYQWTKARLLYIRSNLLLRALQASAIAVVLESMHLFKSISFITAENGIKNLHSPVNLCQVTVRHKLRRLVADTNLETGRAPVDKLNRPLGLNAGNGSVHLLGNNVTTVEQAGGHIFSVTRITLDHLIMGLEAGVGDFLDRIGFVRGPGGRDDRGVRNKRKVDAGVWDKIGLELVQVDVKRTVKTKRSSNARNNCLKG